MLQAMSHALQARAIPLRPPRSLRTLSLTLGSGFILLAAWAYAADAPAPAVIRGKIASIDAKSISIGKADGSVVTASLGPEVSFATVESRRFDQIKDTDFVGVTSVPGPGGMLMAREVHIFPWKGLAEGSYPWDHEPGGGTPAAAGSTTNGTVAIAHDQAAAYTMTNANVTASTGGQLTVSYQGSAIVGGKCVGHKAKADGKPCRGVATVVVAPSTPVVAIVPAKPTEAKPGLAVFAIVSAGPNGNLTASSVVVEKNGVRPLF
jgi:hypothetical protein